MDPTDVVRVLWQQRRYVAPALVVALIAVAYVYQFAPRSYESTATYALVNPSVPSAEELDADPGLAALNRDNPYLRSADSNLVTDALIARLTGDSAVKSLDSAGIGTDYGVGPGAGGNGFVVDITGVGATPDASIETTSAVGTLLERELRELQKVNGADDRYLFTPLLLAAPESATEKFSSRLRAVIVVLLGGGVLVFGAASLGRFRDGTRARRASAGSDTAPPTMTPQSDTQVVEISPQSHERDPEVTRQPVQAGTGPRPGPPPAAGKSRPAPDAAPLEASTGSDRSRPAGAPRGTKPPRTDRSPSEGPDGGVRPSARSSGRKLVHTERRRP